MSVILMLALTCALTITIAVVDQICVTHLDCDPSECCQFPGPIMVMSRRQDRLSMLTAPMTGACQKYLKEGASCDPYDDINGLCGCTPGTLCLQTDHFWTTFNPLATREGYAITSKCEKMKSKN
ncbi:hypothetical protein Btru_014916 [Bulinus truncatus]|nr:hypothetical protein Btru_014916 [Bulinus truncatus]